MTRTFYTVSDVERDAKGHFFSKDAMRFFKSRVLDELYQGPGGIYFVTSERGPSDIRRYTVREYNAETRSVHTAGEFNQMTKGRAQRTARDLASRKESENE